MTARAPLTANQRGIVLMTILQWLLMATVVVGALWLALLLSVAQLKNDLPQVRQLDLDLVNVGVDGTTVLTALARVEPAVDARTDWFVRRMAVLDAETSAGWATP